MQPPFTHDPPQHGAFLRFVRSLRIPHGYDPAKDPHAIPLHAPVFDPVTGRGDKGGRQAGRSVVHKTRSVDYGFVAAGRRTLILDEQEVPLGKGDFVIELGNYHAWSNPEDDSLMGYVMIGATYDIIRRRQEQHGQTDQARGRRRRRHRQGGGAQRRALPRRDARSGAAGLCIDARCG